MAEIDTHTERPAPMRTIDNEFFWDEAKAGRLVAQRCADCGRYRHPPRPMCPACHSLGIDVVDIGTVGELYSYALLHYPQNPRFSYPVVAVLVSFPHGIRLLSNLVDIDASDIHIGMRVEVLFAATAEGGAVPVFRPVKTSASS